MYINEIKIITTTIYFRSTPGILKSLARLTSAPCVKVKKWNSNIFSLEEPYCRRHQISVHTNVKFVIRFVTSFFFCLCSLFSLSWISLALAMSLLDSISLSFQCRFKLNFISKKVLIDSFIQINMHMHTNIMTYNKKISTTYTHM